MTVTAPNPAPAAEVDIECLDIVLGVPDLEEDDVGGEPG